MGGQGGALALHACTYCYIVYHTACVSPPRHAMVMPGVEWACPVCCKILEEALLAAGPAVVGAVEAAVVAAAGGPHGPRPPLQPRTAYDLLTRWMHWSDVRLNARWATIEGRFAALLATWRDAVARNVEAALGGTRSAHPFIDILPSGRRAVVPPYPAPAAPAAGPAAGL
jgi:hypothetical protein